jgi:outer membrane receptor protein involved in Fe transport
LALLPIAEATLFPAPALAREAKYTFDIPAGPIGRSLSAVSQATGVAIGWPGDMPQFRAPMLRGSMSVPEALRRLLGGSGWKAAQAGPTAFRIVFRLPSTPPPRLARIAPPARNVADVAPISIQDIVVTGQKRSQFLKDVPMSVAILSLDDRTNGRLSLGTRDIALAAEGLALTNLGPGRNRQFIRGVADSPFNGPSQSTVAVQLDETRVTFDAPDPDLRLVDVQRVEILKGPQGPLYGSGALGGIYHIVTRKPDLASLSGNARLIGEAVQHGSPGIGGEAVINLPIETDRLGLRGVGYVLRAGGWIDNLGRNRDANDAVVSGGRLALRWQPDTDWTLDVAGVLQNTNSRDSQYVTSSDDTTSRVARIPEPSDNDFKSIAATVEGRLGTLKLLATTSYVDHGVDYTLDSTDASSLFGVSGPSRFLDDRSFTITNHEIRISPEASSRWVAGLSYMRTQSRSIATVSTASDTLTVESLNHKVTEFAAFGEATVPLAHHLNVTAGLRLFRTIAEDEALEQSGGSSDRISKTIASPSLSLAWTPGDKGVIYLRYARALRPGGLAPAGDTALRRFDSDELGTFDLGARISPVSDLSLSASAFYTIWNDIQSDYLLPNGLISTRNAGKGRIYGIEASAEWRPLEGFEISAGGTYIDANLVVTPDGLELDDRRLPVTPDLTGRLAAQYDFVLGRWMTSVSAQANYIGRARLTFDENLDREMGNYATVATSAFFTREHFTLGARIDNLFDIKGDSFAFGNQFSIMEARQYTPLRPRTFTLSIARSW